MIFAPHKVAVLGPGRSVPNRQDGFTGGSEVDRERGRDQHVDPYPALEPGTAVPRRTGWHGLWGRMVALAKIPDSTKSSLQYRLAARARENWPGIDRIKTRYRTGFACVDALLADGATLRLYRLRCTLATPRSGASRSTGPSTTNTRTRSCPRGLPFGPADDALDTAGGLLLADPHGLDLNPDEY
jgi:hypothetical protein